jgi:hypothetical protein
VGALSELTAIGRRLCRRLVTVRAAVRLSTARPADFFGSTVIQRTATAPAKIRVSPPRLNLRTLRETDRDARNSKEFETAARQLLPSYNARVVRQFEAEPRSEYVRPV